MQAVAVPVVGFVGKARGQHKGAPWGRWAEQRVGFKHLQEEPLLRALCSEPHPDWRTAPRQFNRADCKLDNAAVTFSFPDTPGLLPDVSLSKHEKTSTQLLTHAAECGGVTPAAGACRAGAGAWDVCLC